MSIRTSLNYSSVIINQNQAPVNTSSKLSVNDEQWRYQTFFLPPNYTRGSDDQLVPQLSGFQIFASIPDGFETSTSFEWVIQRRNFGVGWVTLASGRQLGVDDSGPEVWPTVFFESVDVATQIEERYRIGIKSRIAQSGSSGEGSYDGTTAIIEGYSYPLTLVPNNPIEILHQGIETILILDEDQETLHWYHSTGLASWWFSTPNPLADQFAYATDSDEIPLVSGPDQYSFGFRVLGLTADEGIDFLGNRYRSAVRTHSASSTDSINGNPDYVWMSKPNPSRFAVESLYFDVRPQPQTDTFGTINYVRDPNGEGPLNGYQDNGSITHSSSGDQAIFRNRSLKLTSAVDGTAFTYWDVPTSDMTDFGGQDAYLSFYSYYPSSWTHAGSTVRVGGLRQVSGTDTVLTINTSDLPRDKWVRRTFHIQNVDASKTLRIILDNQGIGDVYYGGLMLTVGAQDTYADGGFPDWSWTGMPHDSISVEHLPQNPEDEVAVIDRVFIDPATPGIWCSVYYSYDGNPGTNDDEWDNRVWRRIDATYQLKEKKAYALPEPVLAKYIKLEFSHLQPQQYSPGDFNQPISYKKHPKWVLEYFMARLESDRQTTNQTVAAKVGVVYDALDLLYNYYLDDLGQEPDSPKKTQPDFNAQKELSGVYEDVMDIEMIDKISTVMRPYSEYANNWGSGSLLGEVSLLGTNSRLEDYPYEKATQSGLQQKTDYAALRNINVAFESDYPVMFFYLDGPHRYRVIQADFSHNRAYFAGIREVAFLRDQYTPAFDADQYIENGGDTFNAERSEFTIIDGKLTIPD